MPALDIEQRQILVDYFDDPNGLRWHHRILAVPLGGSRWIWITPDLGVQAAQHRINLRLSDPYRRTGEACCTSIFLGAGADTEVEHPHRK